jgi:LysR family hydrogen peroxide-inducible transcriptional activator
MLSLQQIQYIVSVAEERSFNKASEVCFVTQPTLSMQVKKAETALEHQIFDRSSNPITLTDFGEQFLEIARDILNEEKRIDKLIKTFEGNHIETVRIGVIPTISAYLIPDMYEDWKSSNENMRLVIEEMKTEDLVVALEEGRVDLGIMSGPYVNTKCRITRLYTEEIKAFYPSSKKKIISASQLTDLHPWLLTSGNCLRNQMVNFCELHDEENTDDWDYQGGNMDLLMNMVRKFGGYTLIPEFYADDSNDFVSIRSEIGETPAREVIALSRNRSVKWDSMERIIRSIQLRYDVHDRNEQFTFLNWK